MKKSTWLGNMAVCLGLSFLTFFLIVSGAYFLINQAASRIAGSNDTAVTKWEFVWSENKAALEGSITQWKLANEEQPIRKSLNELFRCQYIRLHATLPASDQSRSLELVTAGNPVKICLNDTEVLNNQYTSGFVTGNRVNVVTVPASYNATQLDIYMRVPFSFSLTARLTSSGNLVTVASMTNVIGFAVSLAVMATGVILILLIFLFSIKNKGLVSSLWLSLVIIATGADLFLSQLSLHSTSFTSPWLWTAQVVILLFTAAGISYAAVSSVGGWHLPEKFAVGLLILTAAAWLLLWNGVGPLLLWGFPLLLIFTALIIMLRLSDAILSCKPGAMAVIYSYMTAIFCEIYDTMNLVLGWNFQTMELRFFGLLLFGIVTFSVLIRQAISVNVRLPERELQIEKDTEWVKKTVNGCTRIFAQKTLAGFCTETAKTVKELVLFDQENGESSVFPDTVLRVNTALCSDGHFEEIYSENKTEPCDYSRILEHFVNSKNESLLFGDHTLSMVLHASEKQYCILHIDGIQNGLSANLQNIIRSAFTAISAALDSLELKQDMVQMQENVFINLAEIVEQKSMGTGIHLHIVADMAAILCDELGIPEHEKHIISMASMVHDIGKLAIPEAIIGKTGKLTEEEFAIMQDHVIYGYNMMTKSPGEFMAAAAVIAQQHHEKYDGTGYLELRGEQIHLYARIVAIADVFDALLSDRPYKKAWTAEEACAYVNEQSGRHFDPHLVEVFNRCKNRLVAVKRRYIVN